MHLHCHDKSSRIETFPDKVGIPRQILISTGFVKALIGSV